MGSGERNFLERSLSGHGFFFLTGLHILLALIVSQSEIASVALVVATGVVGAYVALTTSKFERVGYIVAYIVGSEVLWRMTDGAIFWEIGKYGAVSVAAIALFRMKRVKIPGLLLLYFTLLLPSTVLSAWESSFDEARQAISFNLSGPFAILGLGWFFASLKINAQILRNILLMFLLPIIGIGSLSLFGILTAAEINFTTESNFQTSGGFGPNQVGSLLGLGALVAFLLSLLEPRGLGRNRFFYFFYLAFFCLV